MFGNLFRQIDEAHENLRFAQNEFDNWASDDARNNMTNCLIEYLRLLRLEETFWRKNPESLGLKKGTSIRGFFILRLWLEGKETL